MTFNPKLCDERHHKIEKEFTAVWSEMKNQRNKLWAIILMVLGNLIAMGVGIFLVWGKSVLVY